MSLLKLIPDQAEVAARIEKALTGFVYVVRALLNGGLEGVRGG